MISNAYILKSAASYIWLHKSVEPKKKVQLHIS